MSMNIDPTEAAKVKTPVYLVWRGEFVLNSSIEPTWSHVINYPSWQNYTVLEHISGNHGKEGELVLLKKEEGSFNSPPYYARTIKLEPPTNVIWKTFPGDDGQEADYFGIVDFELKEINEKTMFRYQLLYEFLVRSEDQKVLAEFRHETYLSINTMLSTIFSKLTALIESSHD